MKTCLLLEYNAIKFKLSLIVSHQNNKKKLKSKIKFSAVDIHIKENHMIDLHIILIFSRCRHKETI